MDLISILSNSTDIYILLTFRVEELTYNERKDVIMALERTIPNKDISKYHIHLVWANGYNHSSLKIWSEANPEEIIPFDNIAKYFSGAKLEIYPMPEYLQERANTEHIFIIFPDRPYVYSMLEPLKPELNNNPLL